MISHLSQFLPLLLNRVKHRLRDLAKPDNYGLAANVMADLAPSKTELILANTFVRQQLIILDRQVKRPVMDENAHPFESAEEYYPFGLLLTRG